MSKHTLYFAFAALLLCACNTTTPTDVSFNTERLSPLMFEFTNNSIGYQEYRWDFGDGTFSLGRDALKTYSDFGTYTVTLTAIDESGVSYRAQMKLQVTQPNVYIAGYKYYHLPYEQQYYKIVFKDDNLLPSSWDFSTVYSPMLWKSDLPYIKRFNTPVLMNFAGHTYYTVQVVRTQNASSTSGDISCMKQQLKVSELKKYNPEYVLQTETGATAIGIIMEYTY